MFSDVGNLQNFDFALDEYSPISDQFIAVSGHTLLAHNLQEFILTFLAVDAMLCAHFLKLNRCDDLLVFIF